jgi:hypothetical protein
MRNSKAVKPDFFNSLPTIIREREAKEIGASDEEKLLSSMSSSGGWRVLSDYIDNLIDDLDKGTETAMAQGLPFEEIGRNAVVINLAKGVILRIKQKVQDAKESVEDMDGTLK